MKKKISDKQKTQIIYDALTQYLTSFGRDRENIILPELRLGTGFSGASDRYIDIFTISSSKGNVTTAYEIKASRQDFLKDIKNPLKQRGARLYSTYFYYVAPKGMIKLEEVPLWAGLIEIDIEVEEPRYSLCYPVSAPSNARQTASWSLICALTRKVNKEIGLDKIKQLEIEKANLIKKHERQLKDLRLELWSLRGEKRGKVLK